MPKTKLDYYNDGAALAAKRGPMSPPGTLKPGSWQYQGWIAGWRAEAERQEKAQDGPQARASAVQALRQRPARKIAPAPVLEPLTEAAQKMLSTSLPVAAAEHIRRLREDLGRERDAARQKRLRAALDRMIRRHYPGTLLSGQAQLGLLS